MEQDSIPQLQQMPYMKIEDNNMQADFLSKVIIIGDTGVGKSCLMKRVIDNTFNEEHKVTIGVENGTYLMKCNHKVVKLQIWDTAGQESYRSVTRIFYKGANCVMLAYDITRDDTFANLSDWMREI